MHHSLTQYQIIPKRIILRNNNYTYRKTPINKKFQWLNKYLQVPSPKLTTPHKLTRSPKILSQFQRNRSLHQKTRHKTQVINDIPDQTLIMSKNSNNISFRKTTHSKIYHIQKSKNQSIFGTCVAKYLQLHKTKSQFAKNRYPYSPSKHQPKRRYELQDSQIQPWASVCCSDEDTLCYKDDIAKIR